MIHTITYDEDEEFTSIPNGVGVFPPLRYAITGLFRVFPPLRYAITALFRVFPPLRYVITGLFRVFPPLRYAITALFRVFPPLRYAITGLFRVFPPLRYAITALFRVFPPLRYPLKLTSDLHSHCHESSNRFQTIPNDFNVQLPMMKTKSSKGFQYVPNGVRVSSIPFRCPVFRLDVRYSIRASSILLGCPVSLVAFHFLHVSGEEVTSELHSHCHESSNRFQTIPNDSKRLQTLLRCPTVDIGLNEIRKEVKTLG